MYSFVTQYPTPRSTLSLTLCLTGCRLRSKRLVVDPPPPCTFTRNMPFAEDFLSKCSAVALKSSHQVEPVFTSRGKGPLDRFCTASATECVALVVFAVACRSPCRHTSNECATQGVPLANREICKPEWSYAYCLALR